MNALGWLVLGLLAGWVIEFVIDFQYWRKKARLEAERLSQRESAIDFEQTEMGQRRAALRLREREMADLQSSLAARDAELLQAARRIEERADDLGMLEQATEKRRADLDRIGLSLNEREKEINGRVDQLRSRESDYSRRLNALEVTEHELARRVAVVGNREEAMQSWEGRILSREHDVADREASVNYHASRIAADAGAFDAARHLLELLQRPDGEDNLQVLVGIDADSASLLKKAGIGSFERLAETPLGELTRLLQQGGPKYALVDPMSWPEQAAYVLDRDYVALDRLQSRLKGIERASVSDALLAAMLKKPARAKAGEGRGGAAGEGGADTADTSAASETADAVGIPEGREGDGRPASQGDQQGRAHQEAPADTDARPDPAAPEALADPENARKSATPASPDGATSPVADAAEPAGVPGNAAVPVEGDARAVPDAPGGAAAPRHATVSDVAAGVVAGAMLAGAAGGSVQPAARMGEPTDERPPVVWGDDSGDGAEGTDVHVAIERVAADVVEGDTPGWPAGGDISDAQVLSGRPPNR